MYEKLLISFCKELSATFPELSAQADRALSITPAQFLASWRKDLHILRDRTTKILFTNRKGLLLGDVCVTPEMFGEASESTISAIWKYLRTILIESVKIVKMDTMDVSSSQIVLEILTEEKLGSGSSAEGKGKDATFEKLQQLMEDFKPFIDMLKEMLSKFLGDSDMAFDISGLAASFSSISGVSLPTIPKHLLSGHIASLAKDLMKHFQPSDFGIDPSILECEDVDEIVQKLTDLFMNDTPALVSGMRNLAEKIKVKIMGGSVRQAEIVAEAKEFVALFRANPFVQECVEKVTKYFKEGAGKDMDISDILEKFGAKGLGGISGISDMIQTFLNSGSGSSGSAPSDRRRAVQERLRKKLAKKNKQ